MTMSGRWAAAAAVLLSVAWLACTSAPAPDQGPAIHDWELNLAGASPQTRQFEFGGFGWYDLSYSMKLRHGPGSSPNALQLAGTVLVHDADGRLEFQESFREEVSPSQIGGQLLSLRDPLRGRGPRTMSVVLDVSPEFLDRYSDLRVSLIRNEAWGGVAWCAAVTWLVALLGLGIAALVLRDSTSLGSGGSTGRILLKALWVSLAFAALLLGGLGVAGSLLPRVGLSGGWVDAAVLLLLQIPCAGLVRFTTSGRLRSGPSLARSLLASVLISAALLLWMLVGVIVFNLTY